MSKAPKIPEKDAAELAEASRIAYSDPEVDKFMEEVLAGMRDVREHREAQGEHVVEE